MTIFLVIYYLSNDYVGIRLLLIMIIVNSWLRTSEVIIIFRIIYLLCKEDVCYLYMKHILIVTLLFEIDKKSFNI